MKLQVVPRREQTHSSVFMEQYTLLRAWAVRLTDGDQAEAEDVLHDSFVQFVRLAPDLSLIENPGAYLNRLVRNLHLARIARRARLQYVDLDAVDYDSLALSVRHASPLRIRELEEELKSICAWSVSRRPETRAASFLILRFFLGYLPSEITRLGTCSRESLEKGLQNARAEIRKLKSTPQWSDLRRDMEQLLGAQLPLELWLRKAIFTRPATPCLPPLVLSHTLLENSRCHRAIDRSLLAHLTACVPCLEQANQRLQIPSLSDRGGDLGSDKGSRREVDALLHRATRSCEEIFEHRPARVELCVNAESEMSFTVQSRRTVLVVELNRTRTIEFIEAFSEQGVRLLYMPVVSPDEGGRFLQSSAISFSEGRELSIEIAFRNPKTEVVICYTDPQHHFRPSLSGIGRQTNGQPNQQDGPLGWLQRLGTGFAPRRTIRPWAYAVLLLLIFLLPITQDQQVTLSAEEILTRAASWEAQRSHDDSVVHRSFEYVEHSMGNEVPVRLSRVETWSNASRHRTLRRLLDVSGKVQAASSAPLAPAATGDTAWEYVPGAESFRLLSSTQRVQIAQNEGRIRISTPDIALELDQVTYHPLEQSFRVDNRKIQIVEISNEVISIAASPLREELSSPALPPSAPLPSRTALDETELEVRERLHVLDADLGEDIRVLSTPREVRVFGVIESESRRSLIQQNLRGLPLVEVALLSPQEAARHEHLTYIRTADGGEMEQPLLASWLISQWPAIEERDQHVQQMLLTMDRCNEHVLAWSDLQQRYPDHADPRVIAIERDHEQRATEEINHLLSLLPSTETGSGESAGPFATDPLPAQAQRLNQDLEQLLTVHAAQDKTPSVSLAQVRQNLADLARAMHSTAL